MPRQSRRQRHDHRGDIMGVREGYQESLAMPGHHQGGSAYSDAGAAIPAVLEGPVIEGVRFALTSGAQKTFSLLCARSQWGRVSSVT
jgi:hypothetical protein